MFWIAICLIAFWLTHIILEIDFLYDLSKTYKKLFNESNLFTFYGSKKGYNPNLRYTMYILIFFLIEPRTKDTENHQIMIN